MTLHVYSGKCYLGECGTPTNLKTYCDQDLFVGDIVNLVYNDSLGVNYCHGLSVVVTDRYTTYTDGSESDSGEDSFYVMGIKTNCDEGEVNKETGFQIIKVKDWADVIDGEHWKEYGFNYKLKN